MFSTGIPSPSQRRARSAFTWSSTARRIMAITLTTAGGDGFRLRRHGFLLPGGCPHSTTGMSVVTWTWDFRTAGGPPGGYHTREALRIWTCAFYCPGVSRHKLCGFHAGAVQFHFANLRAEQM